MAQTSRVSPTPMRVSEGLHIVTGLIRRFLLLESWRFWWWGFDALTVSLGCLCLALPCLALPCLDNQLNINYLLRMNPNTMIVLGCG